FFGSFGGRTSRGGPGFPKSVPPRGMATGMTSGSSTGGGGGGGGGGGVGGGLGAGCAGFSKPERSCQARSSHSPGVKDLASRNPKAAFVGYPLAGWIRSSVCQGSGQKLSKIR